MSDILKKVGIVAGIFCGVILVMSLAAKVMMQGSRDLSSEYDAALEKLASDTGTPTPSPQEPSGGAKQDSSAVDVAPTAEPTATPEAGQPDTADNGGAAADTQEPVPVDQGAGTEETATAKRTVVIDAAHQASNDNGREPLGPESSETKNKVSSGAEGVATHTPEYELVLQIAFLLRDELTKRGYDVYMIREDNSVSISDATRAQTANLNGDIVVHIHANADDREGIRGIMVFEPSKSNSFVAASVIEESNKLGSSIITELEAATEARSWGVIAHDRLTALNWTRIPASHVEVGYLSNPEEDRLLQTAEYRGKIAEGIADGIDKYFGE